MENCLLLYNSKEEEFIKSGRGQFLLRMVDCCCYCGINDKKLHHVNNSMLSNDIDISTDIVIICSETFKTFIQTVRLKQ